MLVRNAVDQLGLINKCLQEGGVICFPTETVLALACDATNLVAINKIYQIKSRDKAKPLSILVQNLEVAKQYVQIDEQLIPLIKKFSPGPITYILPNKTLPHCPKAVGIRIPDHPTAQLILKNYPKPLIGTSVNISGEASATALSEIPAKLKDSIDLIIEPIDADHASGVPSTVLDLSKPGEATIIREGKITKEEIDSASAQIYNKK
jgi:L-threonylcarbamoyladenylate synthase